MAATRPPFHHQNSTAGDAKSYEMKPTGGVGFEEEIDDGSGEGLDNDRFDRAQADREDMYRMNKKQELRRNFRFLSIFGYSLILGNGWVYSLTGAITSLTNGGTAGGIWMYLIQSGP